MSPCIKYIQVHAYVNASGALVKAHGGYDIPGVQDILRLGRHAARQPRPVHQQT